MQHIILKIKKILILNKILFVFLILLIILILNIDNEFLIKNSIKYIPYGYFLKTNDIHLINKEYPLKDVCEIVKEQKNSNFYDICTFIQKNDLSILTNDDLTFINKLNFSILIKDLKFSEGQRIILKERLKTVKEDNIYLKIHKLYIMENI